jgi:hypothetical protein
MPFWVSAGTKWSYLADSFAAAFPATMASNDSLATIVAHGTPTRDPIVRVIHLKKRFNARKYQSDT